MGSLYRPTYRAADGTKRESAVIWLIATVEGRVILPRVDRGTIAELAETLKAEYQVNGRRSAKRLGFSLAHLLPLLGPSGPPR